MLEAVNVTKTFGGLVAIDGVDLEVRTDEIVGLIGPNGAGKTTLFDTITGVVDPDDGTEIRLDGADLVALDAHEIARAGLSRTFQTVRVFGEMTALDNAAAAALFGTDESVSQAAADRRGRAALAFVGLDDAADAPAASLPIARRRRLELARAVASDPELILLDEIATGLTPGEVAELSGVIRRLRDDRGISVLWIEHVIDAIAETADRIVVLDGGRKIADGTPAEIRRDAAVTAAYLGTDG